MLSVNNLYCGDCLEVMQKIDDKSIDMVLCDLPYGTTACKWDTIIPFEPLWVQYKRIIKDRGAIALFGNEPFSSYLRISNIEWFKYDWVWDKVTARGHLVAKYRPMQQTEIISVFGHGKIKYFPIMIDRPKEKIEVRNTREYARTEIMGGDRAKLAPKIYDKWYPKTLLRISNAGSSVTSIHPTQKPVELCEYLINTYSKEGELILDNCSGSLTTAVACDNLKRNWICIEKEKNYCKVGLQRVNENRKLLGIPVIGDYLMCVDGWVF